MATLSARTISVEETSRIAGGINDPARMVGTFPRCSERPRWEQHHRGSWQFSQGRSCGAWKVWKIPNLNHFSDDGSTGGPINVLNSGM